MDGESRPAWHARSLSPMWNDYAGLPPFRRCDAAAHGLSDADVRRLLGQGVLVRLGHGLLAGYRRPELAREPPEQVALRALAMQRRYPTAIAGYRTAAALRGLWLVGPVGPVHLLRRSGRTREKHDVRVETAYLPPEHCGVAAGVDATTVERTVADLAGRLCPGEALAAVDSALRMDAALARIDEAAAVAGHDVDSLTRRVIRAGDVRSDSPLESMSRWLIHDHGLPSPEPHVLIGDDEGPFAVVDFLWREQRVIGEVDGMLKYDVDRSALRAEKLRQERLERLGFRVVRWGWHDVTVAPYLLAARLSRCLTAI